ncbi:MAG: DUF4163 domain-containing protein [Lachnospiraceae bacterium]|nr:DUF4163 domain-containing protein [Lachnospiraceae bacterium]
MNNKWSGGKIAALVVGSLAGVFLLVAAFCLDIYRFYDTFGEAGQTELAEEDSAEEELTEADEDAYDWKDELKKDKKDSDKGEESDKDEDEKKSEEDEYWEGIEYYQFTDYIRDDLSYQVELENFEVEGDNTYIDINYPVVSGDEVANLDGINRALQNELTAVENYVEQIEAQLMDDESYEFLVDGYVTYMSEEVLSVAYVEYGYLNGEFYESYIISVNIDMTTGMVMDNTQILEIDDEFSIDFRERCDEQNGSIDELSIFSDQEITEYLNDSEQAIILYTPLGMEVGMNYYGGWVTVTYHDYQEFLKQL